MTRQQHVEKRVRGGDRGDRVSINRDDYDRAAAVARSDAAQGKSDAPDGMFEIAEMGRHPVRTIQALGTMAAGFVMSVKKAILRGEE